MYIYVSHIYLLPGFSIDIIHCQVLETSDLPGGVINILTGSSDHITKYLVEHQVDISFMSLRQSKGCSRNVTSNFVSTYFTFLG